MVLRIGSMRVNSRWGYRCLQTSEDLRIWLKHVYLSSVHLKDGPGFTEVGIGLIISPRMQGLDVQSHAPGQPGVDLCRRFRPKFHCFR